MSDTTNRRKQEVIDIIRRDPDTDRRLHAFDAVRLVPRALPDLNLRDVDPSIEFLGRRLSFPLLISPMTGGDHASLRTINRHLAQAAESERVALSVGSQRVMFTHPESRDSFDLRPLAPSVSLLSNLGAVQLNHGFGVKECREAIRVLDADGICFHLNPLQEVVQPEGDTDFGGLADALGRMADSLDRPVLVKEVGAGLSRKDAEELCARGIRYLDVAGTGGTSWSRIEYRRQPAGGGNDLGLVFQDWGLPTPEALHRLAPLRPGVFLIASGGVRTGLDMVKAMVLGASLCGMALPFLEPALESAEAVARMISRLRREFRTAMFLLGVARAEALIGRTDWIGDGPDSWRGAAT